MSTYCKADCSKCGFKENCKGCIATCGSPFGGTCIAAECIKTGGIEAYNEFKEKLRAEINELLASIAVPAADCLYELCGEFVNLPYVLPSGQIVKLLNDKDIYLGAQIEFADMGICYGVVADKDFILICSYSVDGSEPEIVLYKRR